MREKPAGSPANLVALSRRFDAAVARLGAVVRKTVRGGKAPMARSMGERDVGPVTVPRRLMLDGVQLVLLFDDRGNWEAIVPGKKGEVAARGGRRRLTSPPVLFKLLLVPPALLRDTRRFPRLSLECERLSRAMAPDAFGGGRLTVQQMIVRHGAGVITGVVAGEATGGGISIDQDVVRVPTGGTMGATLPRWIGVTPSPRVRPPTATATGGAPSARRGERRARANPGAGATLPRPTRPLPPPPPAPTSPTSKPARHSARKARAKKATGGESAPATNVARLPHIDFHELVRAGKMNPLTVRLSDAITAADREAAIAVAIEAGMKAVTLQVSLSAPGFVVAPKRELPLVVGRDFDAAREQVTFQLTAQEPAGGEPVKREISADIWLGNASIGGVKHWTEVVPAKFRGPHFGDGRSRTAPFALDAAEDECDWVIRVEGKDESGTPPYQVSVRSQIPGGPEYESRRMGRIALSRSQFAATMRKQFERFAQGPSADATAKDVRAWREGLLQELDTLGRWLWTRLPQKLRDEYFRLHDARQAPKSILVHSDEMLIPWELIIPFREGKALPRLGVAHVMGRWRPSLGIRPRPQRMSVASPTIVNPKYGGDQMLLWSLLEASDLRTSLPAFRALHPVDRKSVAKLLSRTDVRLLHFTGHGKYAPNADLSTLLLEGGDTLTAMALIGAPLLAKGQPIIYLNACEAGNTGVVMGRMGGFAAQCVENGCSGVIAPYWAVADESARDFAVAFYDELRAGRSIGEALRLLRKRNPKNPTFQAFAYLGDPWTRPQFTVA